MSSIKSNVFLFFYILWYHLLIYLILNCSKESWGDWRDIIMNRAISYTKLTLSWSSPLHPCPKLLIHLCCHYPFKEIGPKVSHPEFRQPSNHKYVILGAGSDFWSRYSHFRFPRPLIPILFCQFKNHIPNFILPYHPRYILLAAESDCRVKSQALNFPCHLNHLSPFKL